MNLKQILRDSQIPTCQHAAISVMTLLCRSSEVNQETYHAMPPSSTNRSVTQLFIKSVPPMLKPGAHNQMLVPDQSADETTCSPSGNKTWKETDEGNKEPNVATAASKSGICYHIFVSYRRVEIDMEREWEKKKKRERELFAGLSRFSINSAATHPMTGGRLSIEPRLRQNLQIHSHVTNMNISHQRDGSLFLLPLQTAWFPNDLIAPKTAISLNCIPDIESMPATCLSTLHLLILPPPCFPLFFNQLLHPLFLHSFLFTAFSHALALSLHLLHLLRLSNCIFAHLHMRLSGIKKTHCLNLLWDKTCNITKLSNTLTFSCSGIGFPSANMLSLSFAYTHEPFSTECLGWT